MANLRTVHGGADSALAVEVSAWRRNGDGISGGMVTLDGADGVGVYLRNPLALHVQDFEPGVGTIEQASAAAFAWAAHLAEHLGAPVVSGLPRPPVPAAPVIDPATLAEVAACLWEAALDLRSCADAESGERRAMLGVRLDSLFDAEGTAEVRARVCAYAADCESAWQRLTDAERDEFGAFDWEFVPDWLLSRLELDL